MSETTRQRLDKMLGHCGYGTRKAIKSLVKAGRVTVNGQTASDSGMHLDVQSDTVEVDGEMIHYREHIYLIMNKPSGVISATTDAREPTVVDLLTDMWQVFQPFPVGRLDKDTEGLLILTDDGKLAHRLLSPKHHVPKTYYARINGLVTNSDVLYFQQGVTLSDGYVTLPAQLSILASGDVSEIHVTLFEGKYHQVKRMFEAVGKNVQYLQRIRMGNLDLDSRLQLGEVRELEARELAQLFEVPNDSHVQGDRQSLR